MSEGRSENGLPVGCPCVKQLVDEQANDEGLWFDAQTMPEAYLQQELRRLHRVIEEHQPTSDTTTQHDNEWLQDAAYLARLARGSSWPGDMAERVEKAAERVIAAAGSGSEAGCNCNTRTADWLGCPVHKNRGAAL